MEVRPRWRLHTLAARTIRTSGFRISRADSRFRPADSLEPDGRVRSLGLAAMVVSRALAGRALGQGQLASGLGETDNDSGGDSSVFFPDTALRASSRYPHVREVRIAAR